MSQYSIQQSLGNASGVAVSPINADATLSTGVVLNSSLWAGIGVFARGKPFTVLAVTESNYEDVLGEPLKPSSGRGTPAGRKRASTAGDGKPKFPGQHPRRRP